MQGKSVQGYILNELGHTFRKHQEMVCEDEKKKLWQKLAPPYA